MQHGPSSASSCGPEGHLPPDAPTWCGSPSSAASEKEFGAEIALVGAIPEGALEFAAGAALMDCHWPGRSTTGVCPLEPQMLLWTASARNPDSSRNIPRHPKHAPAEPRLDTSRAAISRLLPDHAGGPAATAFAATNRPCEQFADRSQANPDAKLALNQARHHGSHPYAEVQAVLTGIFAVYAVKHLLFLAGRQTS